MAIPPPIEVTANPDKILGMSAAQFMRDYWQKRPLLIRGAFADFKLPLSPNDLAGLACEDEALSRIVCFDRKRDRWQVENGPFAEERFLHMGTRDWTLLVQDVDRWDADVRALLAHFSFLPSWRIDDIMVSFAAPGGSVGAHVDHYDVFLLQGQGQRHWAIDARAGAPLATRADAPIKLLEHFSASHEWLLGPGDMLYLPPGVPHHGVALDACLTFSIGMRAPSVGEMLVAWAEHRAQTLDEELRYADPDQSAVTEPGLIDAAAIKRLRGALESSLVMSDSELGEFFGRYLSTYRVADRSQRKPRSIVETAIAARLSKGRKLMPAAGIRLNFVEQAEGACLHGAGESLAVTRNVAVACTRGTPISATWWISASAADHSGVCAAIERGWLVFE